MIPIEAVKVIQAISSQFAFASAFVDPISKSATPDGSKTKIKGTRMAGATYFQL